MAEFTRYFKDVLDSDPTIVTGILAEYPLYPGLPEGYREKLNEKIIDHYFNREIGMENESMFRLALKRRLNEQMPIINQHYAISAMTFDPLKTIDMQTLTTGEAVAKSTDTGNNTSNSSAESRVVASDFPQVRLSPDGDYATAAQDNISGSSATGTATTETEQEQSNSGDSKTTGYQGNPAMLIYEYRQTLVNVDMMVIEALQDLFMLIWSTHDEYTDRGYGYAGFRAFPFSI